MGKLPEFFFKTEGTENVNRRAQKLFLPVLILLSVVPVVLIAFSIMQEVLVYKIVLVAAIAAFSLYSGAVSRKVLLLQAR